MAPSRYQNRSIVAALRQLRLAGVAAQVRSLAQGQAVVAAQVGARLAAIDALLEREAAWAVRVTRLAAEIEALRDQEQMPVGGDACIVAARASVRRRQLAEAWGEARADQTRLIARMLAERDAWAHLSVLIRLRAQDDGQR